MPDGSASAVAQELWLLAVGFLLRRVGRGTQEPRSAIPCPLAAMLADLFAPMVIRPVLAGDLRKLYEFVLGLIGTDGLRSSEEQVSTHDRCSPGRAAAILGNMPATSTLLVFALAAGVLVVIPEPNHLYIVARSVGQGSRAGIASALGVEVGTLTRVTAAAVGLSAIIASSAVAFAVVRYAGAAYLVYLRVRTFLSPPGTTLTPSPAPHPLGRVFREGVVVNVLNLKVALFFLALLPQFVDPTRGAVPMQIVVLGALAMSIGLASDILYALSGGTLGALLARRPRFLQTQHYLSSSVYLGLGVAAALTGDPRR